MKKKLTITLVIAMLFFLSVKVQAQDDDRKWSFGINTSTVVFGEEASRKVKEGLNSQFPSIQISRRLVKNLSSDFILTFEGIEVIEGGNEFKYTSLDAYLRYDLPELFLNIVPFVGLGIGYVKGATTTPNPKGSLSLNIMGGGTLWVSKRFGLTGRLMYKQVSSNSESMATHFQALTGIVYKFDMSSYFGDARMHIWSTKH